MSAPAPFVTDVPAQPSVQEFFDSAWATYSAILDNNYMFHREIFSAVGDCLSSHHAGRPFSLVDLGCGDARYIASALHGTAINRYVGYDIAAAALAQSARRLDGLGFFVDLRRGDFMDALRSGDESFDVVFSSFAVHHLNSLEKAEFFRLAAERIVPGGLLILIDVMRAEGEDRTAYLQRYIGRVRTTWTALPSEGLDAVCRHIGESDFPDTPSELARMARDAGFGALKSLPAYSDHHTLIWERTSAHAV